jgi:hypothetical protein
MNKIRFTEKTFEDRFEYHMPATHAGFLNNSIYDCHHLNLDEPAQQTLNTFLRENGVSSLASRENSLLYYLILKMFAQNNICYLIYFDSKDAVKQLHPALKANKCEWRYSIEYISGNELCTTFGFQNPTEFLEAVNYSNKELTNRYFHIAEIDQHNLINYVNLYSSDVTNWCFAFCPAENKETVVQLFTDPVQRPSRPRLLAHINSLVNIQIGGDCGYLDYVLIQSKNSIDIIELENKITTCAVQYATLLEEVNPMDDDWKVDFFKERFDAIFKAAG